MIKAHRSRTVGEVVRATANKSWTRKRWQAVSTTFRAHLIRQATRDISTCAAGWLGPPKSWQIWVTLFAAAEAAMTKSRRRRRQKTRIVCTTRRCATIAYSTNCTGRVASMLTGAFIPIEWNSCVLDHPTKGTPVRPAFLYRKAFCNSNQLNFYMHAYAVKKMLLAI